MTSYALQSLQHPAGLFEFTLWSDLTGLHIPDFNSLSFSGGLSGRADTEPLSTDLDTLTFEYFEDYSYYTQEGFWFKVLNSPCEIQVTVDGEHFFWGFLNDPISNIQETSLVTNYPGRQGTFTLTSMLAKTRTVRTYDVMDALLPEQLTEVSSTVPGNAGGTTALMLKFKALLAGIVATTYSQTFDEDDVEIAGNLADFKITISGNDYFMPDCYLYAGSKSGSTYTYAGYCWLYNPANEYSIDLMYWYAYDFLWMLCKACGLFPSHTYDIATSRHRLRLATRRSMSPQYNTYLAPYESSVLISAYPTVKVVDGARVTMTTRNDARYIAQGNANEGDLPGPLNTDLTVDRLFVYSDDEETWDSAKGWLWLYVLIAGVLTRVDQFDFYKYGTDSWETTEPVHLNYWYYRYSQTLRALQRTYPSIEATNSYDGTVSQLNNRLFALTQDNDGLSTKTYFAAEIVKDPVADETQVTWIEL